MQITLEDGAKANFFDIHHNQNVYIDKLVGTPMPGMDDDEMEYPEEETTDPDDDFQIPSGWDKFPSQVFVNYSNGVVCASIKEAGVTCINGAQFASLMAVCDDHGCLIDRSNKVAFARAMVALRLYKPNKGETCEDTAKRLANNMNRYINAILVPYKDLEETNPTLKKLKQKCISLGNIFESHCVHYRYTK